MPSKRAWFKLRDPGVPLSCDKSHPLAESSGISGVKVLAADGREMAVARHFVVKLTTFEAQQRQAAPSELRDRQQAWGVSRGDPFGRTTFESEGILALLN